MNLDKFEKIINEAFDIKEKINASSDKSIIDAIKETIELTDQGKIIPGHVTGVCAKHQRHLGRAIKQSRNIALFSLNSHLNFTAGYRLFSFSI